jgi:hypothetical protein
MNIRLLNDLRDFSNVDDFSNVGLGEEEIIALENLYNSGQPFPTSLRELLYIAGSFCYLLEYGICKTQQELQHRGITILNDNELIMSRPYYVIDLGTDGFTYVYLDDDKNDPTLFSVYTDNNYNEGHFYSSRQTLSKIILKRLENVKNGYTPF